MANNDGKAWYDKAIEIDPKNTDAWNGKGVALYNLGKHYEAIECYDRAVKIDPNDVSPWHHKGNALRNLGMHNEAIECYDKTNVVSLNNVSFSVNKGEFVSVVGPSGSGKSTLLNMLGALDRPTSGKVYTNGIDIFSLNDFQIAAMRNDTIGFIFQSYNLINRTTVLKNVEIPGIIGGMSDVDRRRRALKLLDFLGIKDKANFKPLNLSGGQQQRVAVARALINDPKMILADEPTGNLDTKTGHDVFNLLTLLSREFRRTIIMVTHNPELAAATDRAIHIRDGAIEKETLKVERQL